VEIPANTTADVYLPEKANGQVFEAGKKVEAEEKDGRFVIHIGSGAYEFEVK
jgi:hypothetical protein